MTAEQYLANVGVSTSPVNGLKTYLKGNVITAMEQFAKLKVDEATIEAHDLITELTEKANKFDALEKIVLKYYEVDENGEDDGQRQAIEEDARGDVQVDLGRMVQPDNPVRELAGQPPHRAKIHGNQTQRQPAPPAGVQDQGQDG